MKKALFNILRFIGFCLSFLYLDKIDKAIHCVLDKTYTGFVAKRFKAFGDSIIMWHPYLLQGLKYVSIGDNTVIEPNVQLTITETEGHTPEMKIGDGCLIRRGSHITAINSITIGNNLLTGTNVLITDNSHGHSDMDTLRLPATKRPTVSKGPVVIGDNVWLGNNVCVLPGVTIGTGVIVGANSIVTHDIPDYSRAVGVPATVKSIKQA